MICEKCGTVLATTSVSIYQDNGRDKQIGEQSFCPKRSCDYEGPIRRLNKVVNNKRGIENETYIF